MNPMRPVGYKNQIKVVKMNSMRPVGYKNQIKSGENESNEAYWIQKSNKKWRK
ncbi:hypothetical protein J7E79_25185 [Bacillus sp. ISL-40]|uniref:hypothetical protein n=1 Tax=unclassified Bacillus (in: firmicutes) TaxID=185979 RepID=UPI001BE5EB66|nr:MULTISPECIES: hypothetical protein [unclassified Bacillus (in: firmicutes)]MBT2700634.1 hypothetical protein [Bacillus sp. ISL-40]MBT2744096.1 hypothetical protein [Bacillus sp. ISL-77]